MKKPQVNQWHSLKSDAFESVSQLRERAKAKHEATSKVDFDGLRNILKIVECMGFPVQMANAYVPYNLYNDYQKDGEVELSIDIKSPEGLKNPKFLGLVGFLDGRFTASNSHDNLSDYGTERVFTFSNDACPIKIRLSVDLDGAAKCRRVKTTVDKLQTVAEFKLVCED